MIAGCGRKQCACRHQRNRSGLWKNYFIV